ncbi:putative naringenin-chalcone synthase [Paenibacillus cellulosilyticus]|uniref:Putative naringenin-chalcone synthase n=1 Tax=Paenibacillus cellulosilyticus TaxID=375489 RepID=A0A2V2YS55_9BACL|nr:type III polyketide synthase [Paenibacillus cellulosilyticus]PWV97412.1 putative naringenin-chalcone synthase [Paenibacillus cellulosilyticus]QKS48547.1 type III polyketide synthase [Paenibacillus cellulosilyticus]
MGRYRIRASKNKVALLGIGTALPECRLDQRDTALRLAEGLEAAGQRDATRWARRIFNQSGVETRHTCVDSLSGPASESRFAPGTAAELVPQTAERMAMYREFAPILAERAARDALVDSGVAAHNITHVLTVSCTGMYLPGLDAELTHRLGLNDGTRRLPLTFLGCAAGMTAMRTARELVAADEQAVALIVCVELCTLHTQPSGDRESLYAAAFFGDGASACVIGRASKQKGAYGDRFLLAEGWAGLAPEAAEAMRWTIGNNGFDLFLSPQVPELLSRYVPNMVEQYAPDLKPDWWAIHPGGRGIVDAVQKLFELSDEDTRASREVLRSYGNMSSVTILFVLREVREKMRKQGSGSLEGLAVAFGPGLTAELMRMTYVPSIADGDTRIERDIEDELVSDGDARESSSRDWGLSHYRHITEASVVGGRYG